MWTHECCIAPREFRHRVGQFLQPWIARIPSIENTTVGMKNHFVSIRGRLFVGAQSVYHGSSSAGRYGDIEPWGVGSRNDAAPQSSVPKHIEIIAANPRTPRITHEIVDPRGNVS